MPQRRKRPRARKPVHVVQTPATHVAPLSREVIHRRPLTTAELNTLIALQKQREKINWELRMQEEMLGLERKLRRARVEDGMPAVSSGGISSKSTSLEQKTDAAPKRRTIPSQTINAEVQTENAEPQNTKTYVKQTQTRKTTRVKSVQTSPSPVAPEEKTEPPIQVLATAGDAERPSAASSQAAFHVVKRRRQPPQPQSRIRPPPEDVQVRRAYYSSGSEVEPWELMSDSSATQIRKARIEHFGPPPPSPRTWTRFVEPPTTIPARKEPVSSIPPPRSPIQPLVPVSSSEEDIVAMLPAPRPRASRILVPVSSSEEDSVAEFPSEFNP